MDLQQQFSCLLDNTLTGFCSNYIRLNLHSYKTYVLGLDNVFYFFKDRLGVKYLKIIVNEGISNQERIKSGFKFEIIDANINPIDFTINRSSIVGFEGYNINSISFYSTIYKDKYKKQNKEVVCDLVSFKFTNKQSLFLWFTGYEVYLDLKKWTVRKYFNQLPDHLDRRLILITEIKNVNTTQHPPQ